MSDLVLHGSALLDDCVNAVAAGPQATALFCDIDGTLCPIAPTPVETVVPEEMRAALAALAPRLGLLAVVTGRAVKDGARLVGLPGLTYVGSHGLEVMSPAGAVRTHPGAEPWVAAVQEVVRRARRAGAAERGVFLEDKRVVLACHYRAAPDRERARRFVEAEVARPARDLGLTVATGKLAYEIRPPLDVSKGSATRELLAAGQYSRALFLGDDLTDVSGFDAVAAWAREGVADSPTTARGRNGPKTVDQREGPTTVDERDGPPEVRERRSERLSWAIAAVGDDTPPEVQEHSTIWVAGVAGVREVLERLGAALGAERRRELGPLSDF